MKILFGIVLAGMLVLSWPAQAAHADVNRPYFILVHGVGSPSMGTDPLWDTIKARLANAGYGPNDFEEFSYAGLSGSSGDPPSVRVRQPDNCMQVGQSLDYSATLLTDLLATRVQHFIDLERRGVGTRRDVTVFGHSLGGLVAVRAMEMLGDRQWVRLLQGGDGGAFVGSDQLLDFMRRHREDPRNPSVTRIVTFDSPLWGSGLFRNATAAILASLKLDICKSVVGSASDVGNDLADRRANRMLYRQAWDESNGRPSVAADLGVQVITIGNIKDFLYNPMAWGRVKLAQIGGVFACIASGEPLTCAATFGGAGATLEDNSYTQIIDSEKCCLWNLSDLGTDGTSPTRSHSIALQLDQSLDWMFENSGLLPTSQAALPKGPLANAPVAAPAAAPVPAARILTFSQTVRLTPNGAGNKHGILLDLVPGDRIVARFSEQLNGDIRLYVNSPDGRTIYNAGQVHGPFETRPITANVAGQYTVWFDNGFSVLSGKTISLQVDYPQH